MVTLDIDNIKAGDIILLETFDGLLQVGLVLSKENYKCEILTDSCSLVYNNTIKYWEIIDIRKASISVLEKLKNLLQLVDVLYLLGLEVIKELETLSY